jgi:hypothetical protein
MTPQHAGQNVLNVLAIVAAAAMCAVITGMMTSLTFELFGGGQTSNIFLMYVLPLLVNCLAAAIAGVLSGLCLRTDHPVFFASLLGGVLVLYRCLLMTVNWDAARWQDLTWIGIDILAPALLAAAVTVLLSRRRGPTPAEATA